MADGARGMPVLAAITRVLRDPAALADMPAGELDFTLRVARRARLLGRLGWQARELGLLDRLPRQASQALLGALALAEARVRLARWELDRIAQALEGLEDCPLVAMKGSAYMLAGLPNAPGRFFADVDLLVAESRLGEVERRLAARGWRAAELTAYDDNYYRLWTHELPPLRHAEREVEVDLHHGIVMRTSRYWADPAPLFAAARPLPGSRYAVLAPVDMMLHAIAHLFAGGEMDDALRELVDIDGLFTHFSGNDAGFRDALWPRAIELRLGRPVFYALRYAHRLLGTEVPAALLEASMVAAPPRPMLAMMDRLVPKSLVPQHPDSPDASAARARRLLFMRTHWVRMPPLMLTRHLAYKFYVRRIQRPARTGKDAAPAG